MKSTRSTKKPPQPALSSSDSEDDRNFHARPASREYKSTKPPIPPYSYSKRDARPQVSDSEDEDHPRDFLRKRSPAKTYHKGTWSDTDVHGPMSNGSNKEEKYKQRYLKTQELYEDSIRKIKELQYTITKLNEELKDNKESTEAHRNTLERLKSKMMQYESSVNHNNSNSELEKENKRLITDITKLKIDLDRAKGMEDLVSHYRLALMKFKAQNTAMKEKLVEYNSDRQSHRGELEGLQRALEETEAKNKALTSQLHEIHNARRLEAKEAEQMRKQYTQELNDLRENKIMEDQNEIAKLRNQVAELEDSLRQQYELVRELQSAIGQQREDFSHHMQAALDLAVSEKEDKDMNGLYTPDLPVPHKQKKEKRENGPAVHSGKRRHSIGKTSYGNGYLSPSSFESSFRADGALSKTGMDKDLKMLNSEIEELQRSLDALHR
ncbi:hypothetical protein PROFUN_06060 [Planoprotostelium fungivorum]|uniref:Uncharacterized protein n=1 Tax=Planoprotostelium fungivorum TaxID=1890364 RepID=A0A2P6NPV6_9EUKA|nr:hypothetical protein PROFUN_06060 [Planoprotostelium fungivorum]